jgi:hypothetical protein
LRISLTQYFHSMKFPPLLASFGIDANKWPVGSAGDAVLVDGANEPITYQRYWNRLSLI